MTSTSTEPIELQPDLMVVEPERDDSGALRAPDGGWGWVCVAGRFFVVALVLGLVSGFGIVYVEIIDHFDTTRVETAWMSSLHSATYCITGLVGGGVLERFGCRAMTVAASILTSAGFIFSLFAQNLVLLCVLYGVLTEFQRNPTGGLPPRPGIGKTRQLMASIIPGHVQLRYNVRPNASLKLTEGLMLRTNMMYIGLYCMALNPFEFHPFPNVKRELSGKPIANDDNVICLGRAFSTTRRKSSTPVGSSRSIIDGDVFGPLRGAGVSLMYTASTVIVLQYFDKKRGLAMSISSLGEGVGMLVLPPLTYLLIETYSWRGAFLVTAGITLNAAVFGLLFKPPPYLSKAVQNNTQRRKKDMLQSFKHLLHKKLFFLFALGSFLVHAGYTVPLINLIDLVDLKDIDKSQSAMLIPAMGVSTIFSLVLFGWVSDFPGVNRTGLHAGSIAVMAVSVMLVPALDSIEAFFVFAAVYGVFMGWLFDITGNYVWSFYVSGGLYLLGCFVTLLVLIARHLATRNKHRRDNAPSAEVRPLSQS
ncbi:uncharacterized protein LOC124114427 isoform X2 [Haliotis rufescens]|uniref:uncharacterized protein LOC124114427 isoform X2 n=1 Tax=Haliotis rufescens TaxID=6454 RepID=UPI00201EEC12|nr:uncharacterized protein LOC124114427 isoform X2 [Haliotis rufescens]